jgi:hypothetical protein
MLEFHQDIKRTTKNDEMTCFVIWSELQKFIMEDVLLPWWLKGKAAKTAFGSSNPNWDPSPHDDS